jgi:putative endonuclease
MKPWFVYMIRCSDTTLYTGVTTDVDRRFAEHKEGGRKGSKYARARIPLKVVYSEFSNSRSEAQKREHEIKKLTRAEKEILVKGWKRTN